MTADPRSPSVLRHEPSFDELMAVQLRRAPWLLLSLLCHALALLLALLIPPSPRAQLVAAVSVEQRRDDELIEPEVEPVEKPEPEQPADEPVLLDADLTDETRDLELADDFAELAADADSAEPRWDTPLGLGGGDRGQAGHRAEGRRRLRRDGGDKVVAIEAGLDWLRRHQDEDGRWDADGFMKHDPSGDPCDGPGRAVHDVGVTGLALLAFLGDGSDLRGGPHRDAVVKAVRWLREQQDDSGLFGSRASHAFVYDHAIAALAMAEAFGLSRAKLLRKSAQAGLDYLESHRNPYMVWRYQPRDGTNDTSVTGWCLMAYKAGRDFDLAVDDRALELSAVWLDQVTDPVTGRCGYTQRGEPSSRHAGDHAARFPRERGECLTAIGLLSRFFLRQDPREMPVMRQAADALLQKPPVWDDAGGSIDHCYWYYATYALYQMGGPHWRQWAERLTSAVVRTQRAGGSARGSWDPAGVWGEDGGRVYSTAILVLTLEAYYRHARVTLR